MEKGNKVRRKGTRDKQREVWEVTEEERSKKKSATRGDGIEEEGVGEEYPVRQTLMEENHFLLMIYSTYLSV